MKKTVLAVLVVLAASWVIYPMVGFTKADFEKGKPCTVCHTKPIKGDENLNDVGKCYKAQPDGKKDLAACEKKK